MRKKAELPRHKTDISWMGKKKNRAEKAKFKSEATQFKEKKSPCFQICCSPRTCIPVRQPSSPLWKGQHKIFTQEKLQPYSEAGHQAGGGVGFDNGKPLGVAVNLPAPLKFDV